MSEEKPIITLHTNMLDLKPQREIKTKRRSDCWTCAICGGKNHFSSDSCYASASCLARYWRGVSGHYRRQAHEAALRAQSYEAIAAAEAAGADEAEA